MVGKVTTRGQGVIMPGRKTVTTTYAKGGKVGKKKQGYKARKDESIAMRVRKKRTKKQLKASRDESYGKWGRGKGKGKINK
ncbi:MAG TPA: hypothetical protein QF698_04310 [Candidatus Marinimicrobia bacterium]|jgi:hypothetical protein|nr:hypothetical protein [Candidatus Neomarinimicrobiota bacterium]|tara:strand:+ start:1316 stop:1558 length:243 start_codon:yes stop_codon:yes gene_type:complete